MCKHLIVKIDQQVQEFNVVSVNAVVMVLEEEAARKDPRYNLNAVNSATKAVLDELDSTYKAPVSWFFVYS